METKTCTSCREHKPLTDFYHRDWGSGPKPYKMCKACWNEDSKARADLRPVAIPGTLRVCSCCAVDKPIEDFPRNKKSRGGYLNICKRCYTIKNANSKWGILNIYEYVDGNLCEICSTVLYVGDRKFAIDHDHSCCPPGEKCCRKCIRGLLCADCNKALGLLRDDPQLLRNAAEYLETK